MFSRRILQIRHNNSISYILLGTFYSLYIKYFILLPYHYSCYTFSVGAVRLAAVMQSPVMTL